MGKILVTGAAGFIGSHLVRELVRQGSLIVGLVRPTSNLWRLEDVLNQIQLLRVELGASSLNQYHQSLREVDTIYHLAASSLNPPGEKSVSLVQTNVMGTLELLNLAVKLSVRRFVYCGSCFEYPSGNSLAETVLPMPISEYAASKTSAWLLAQSFYHRYRLPVVTLRAFTVYGPFESAYRLIPYVINRALAGKEIDLTGGMQTRDFVHVEDMVNALLKAEQMQSIIGETFNVSTGMATSVRSITEMIVKEIGVPAVLKWGARPYRDAEIMQLSGNPSQVKQKLGWMPRTLSEGLSQNVHWFRENRLKYSVYACH